MNLASKTTPHPVAQYFTLQGSDSVPLNPVTLQKGYSKVGTDSTGRGPEVLETYPCGRPRCCCGHVGGIFHTAHNCPHSPAVMGSPGLGIQRPRSLLSHCVYTSPPAKGRKTILRGRSISLPQTGFCVSVIHIDCPLRSWPQISATTPQSCGFERSPDHWVLPL